MSIFSQFSHAIKTLDFKSLGIFLCDKHSYMGVSKKLFLDKLESVFLTEEYKHINEFTSIIPGTCNCDCCYDKKAYRFVGKDKIALDLYFEFISDKITNILLCHGFKSLETTNDECESIYFYFYNDDLLNFVPSQEYLDKKHKVNQAMDDYSILKKSEITTHALKCWTIKHQDIYNDFLNEIPYTNNLYRSFDDFDKLCHSIKNILE